MRYNLARQATIVLAMLSFTALSTAKVQAYEIQMPLIITPGPVHWPQPGILKAVPLPRTRPSTAPQIHNVDGDLPAVCWFAHERTDMTDGKLTFDGQLTYQCYFQTIMKESLVLEDIKKREAWAAEWEHKYDHDGSLSHPDSTDEAIQKMVNSLDERFTYFDRVKDVEAENKTRQAILRGGIGISWQIGSMSMNDPTSTASDKQPMILSKIFKGSPAEQADLHQGDHIIGILDLDSATESADDSINGLTNEQIGNRIQGKVGTAVKFTIERGDETFARTIVRADVHVPVVDDKYVDGGTFYFRLNNFISDSTKEELQQALIDGADADSYILDLRGNHGGYVKYADYLAGALLCEGEYLVMRERTGTKITTTTVVLLPDDEEEVITESGNDRSVHIQKRTLDGTCSVERHKPIIVLIDGASASASEIVSGSLKANHRATIVGKPSMGKGEGQEIYLMPYGRQLKIIAFTLKPGGVDYNWSGIVPDIEVDAKPGDHYGELGQDAQLDAAIAEARKQAAEVSRQKSEMQQLNDKRHADFKKSREQKATGVSK